MVRSEWIVGWSETIDGEVHRDVSAKEGLFLPFALMTTEEAFGPGDRGYYPFKRTDDT